MNDMMCEVDKMNMDGHVWDICGIGKGKMGQGGASTDTL